MKRRFGFIHEKLEIKVLILYILRRQSEGIPIETLAELTLCDDGISYFDFSVCVGELIESGHILLESSLYFITKKGSRNGEATESSLPFSIRQLVDKSAATVRHTRRRDSMIRTLRKAHEDGTGTVVLSMSDGLGEIVKVDIHTVGEKQAIELENGFHKNAEKAYNALIDAILNTNLD